MAPLEPWEKVLIDAEAFLPTVHGKISCLYCHNGVQDPDKDIAHNGLVARPSDPISGNGTCETCHKDEAASFATSLHATQAGYWTQMEARGVDNSLESYHAAEEMFDNHCSSCHTSCGDCHVGQPASVGSGLIEGHVFQCRAFHHPQLYSLPRQPDWQ